MPVFRNFKVNVHVPFKAPEGYSKNLPLVEYGTKPPSTDSDSHQCTRYIAALTGSQFSITVENGAPQDASVLFFVDGQMACCLLCYAKPKYNIVTCQGVQPKPGVLQRFVFRKANRFDENENKSALPSDEVGTIRVVIRRCVVLGYDADGVFRPFNAEKAINEKSQKGLLDAKTGLLEPESYKNGPFANVIYMDNIEPWAEFVFKYKSFDLLQALGIAPKLTMVPEHPPAHKPPVEKRKIHSPGAGELALREENKRLKLELDRLQRQKQPEKDASQKFPTPGPQIQACIGPDADPVFDLTK